MFNVRFLINIYLNIFYINMDASESDVYLSLKMIEVINHPNVSDSHRDDLTGAAIMLLLKRQKINKLVGLQARAQHLYDR